MTQSAQLARTGVMALVAVLMVLLAALAKDAAFAAHAWIGFAAATIYIVYLPRRFPGGAVADTSGYLDGVVRAGAIATVFWGVVGFLVGLVIALQLAYPALNFDLPWTNFGRLRPLHTSAVIFAFGGNALIATSFYVVQRTCRTRLALGNLAWFVFWGYQLFLVLAATGYLLGV